MGRKPPPKPPELEQFEESPTGSHVWVDGQLMTFDAAMAIVKRRSRPPRDEDELTPVTESTVPAKSGPMDWLFKPIVGRLSLAEYALGIAMTLLGGGATSLGLSHNDHQQLLDTAVAACATEESVVLLTERIGEVAASLAVIEAELKSHKSIEAHPGAVKRMGAIETDVAIANKLIEVHHQ